MENKNNNDFEYEGFDNSNEDNIDLFSYDNSQNAKESQGETFDLNNFSSKTAKRKAEAKKKKKSKKKIRQRILKICLSVFLIGLITVSLVVGAFLFYAFTMVDGTMDEDLENSLNFTTTIYAQDASGNYVEYRRLHGEFNRIWKDYDKVAIDAEDPNYDGIPKMLANAFVAIEDKRFFEHDGVDWKRTIGAFINEFVPIYSSRQGGSTITQQLVKNLTDDRSQKASRKVREIMRARYLEGKYSKDVILECYLNTIPMDHGIYGVEVAANYYFGKTVKDLTIAECASLASITKSPSYYSPDSNPENNKKRRESVLFQMYDQGYITKKEYNAALKEELNVVANEKVLSQSNVNSYFVDALIEEVIDDLVEKYGYDESHANQLFYNSGYKIYATMNTEFQAAAEAVFSDSATYAIEGKNGALMTGAITVMDYNGNVKAMVGGIGEKTTNRGFNCATQAVRQPGSTMKPIAAYAPALEDDLITYSTLIDDAKTNYNGWTPVNWYGSYWGNVTVQYALERSINTIPVYLVNKLTPEYSFTFLTKNLGITTLNDEDKNLSPLGMGGTNGGLTTVESAAAFSVFGNGGNYYEPILYTKVENQQGEIVLEKSSKPRVAIGEDTATIMNKLLQTVVTGSQGTGGAAKSYISGMPIYAKTGTSNNQNDLWFVGGTPHYIASVWCGYSELQAIPDRHSGIALKMWGNVMSKIHSGLKAQNFPESSYVVERYYCKDTGDLATDACTEKITGYYKTSKLPSPCSVHVGDALGEPGTEPPSKPENEQGDGSGETEQPDSSEETTENSDNE